MPVQWGWLAAGALVGGLLAVAHVALLKRAVDGSAGLAGDVAKQRMVRGMWLRIGMWIPALLGAALAGLWACIGLVFGSLLGRWLFIWRLRA